MVVETETVRVDLAVTENNKILVAVVLVLFESLTE